MYTTNSFESMPSPRDVIAALTPLLCAHTGWMLPFSSFEVIHVLPREGKTEGHTHVIILVWAAEKRDLPVLRSRVKTKAVGFVAWEKWDLFARRDLLPSTTPMERRLIAFAWKVMIQRCDVETSLMSGLLTILGKSRGRHRIGLAATELTALADQEILETTDIAGLWVPPDAPTLEPAGEETATTASCSASRARHGGMIPVTRQDKDVLPDPIAGRTFAPERFSLDDAPPRFMELFHSQPHGRIWCVNSRRLVKNQDIIDLFRKCHCEQPQYERELPAPTNIQLLMDKVGQAPAKAIWCWSCREEVKKAGQEGATIGCTGKRPQYRWDPPEPDPTRKVRKDKRRRGSPS